MICFNMVARYADSQAGGRSRSPEKPILGALPGLLSYAAHGRVSTAVTVAEINNTTVQHPSRMVTSSTVAWPSLLLL